MTQHTRFTKADAQQALIENGYNWQSPIIDLIDTIEDALWVHYSRQGKRLDEDDLADLAERADDLAHLWAE